MGALWSTFWPAFVVALAGLVALATWALGKRLLGVLVEIAKLPAAIRELVDELKKLSKRFDRLDQRVDALESILPDQVRVRADLTLSTEGAHT